MPWRVGFGVSNTRVRPSIVSCYPCCGSGVSSQQSSTDQDTWAEEAELMEGGILTLCFQFAGEQGRRCYPSQVLLSGQAYLFTAEGVSVC